MERESSGIPVLKRGVIAIAKRDGLFLAIRRGQTVVAGGRVCFPGGHIEPGEKEHEAVVRECAEELAAVVEPIQCVWRNVTAWGTALSWWTVVLSSESVLVAHPIEVDEVFWLSIEQMLNDPTLMEGNREFLEGLQSGQISL